MKSPAVEAKPAILSLQYFCYPDEVGGAWKYTYEVNKRLVRRGYPVVQLTCKPEESLPEREVIEGIHYFRVGVAESKSVVSLWRAIRRLLREVLREFPIRLAHVHNPLVEFLARAGGGLPRRIPSVYHFHSSWQDEERINLLMMRRHGASGEAPSLTFADQARLACIRWIEGSCFSRADRVLFLSCYSESRFRELYGGEKKCVVISGGVDTKAFLPPGEGGAERARQRLGLTGGGPVLLTVRRLAARMGLDNLLRALALVRQRLPEKPFQLVLAGHGPLEAELRALVSGLQLEDCVRMVGRLDADTLAAYYHAADIFILPTAQIEGFGLATAEALACGLPALGTPVGGTIEILNQVDPRLLFTSAAPSAMAEKIADFLLRPEPYLQLKNRCRDTAVSLYDWESVVDRIEPELARAIGANRGGAP